MMHLTLAFADADHARAGMRFVARGAALARVTFAQDGDGSRMSIVELDCPTTEAVRVRTLVLGVRGMVVAESREATPALA